MKIVSRLSEEEAQLQRLRDIIDIATGGSISEGGELEPANDLPNLITQVDITCASLMEALHSALEENAHLTSHITSQEVKLHAIHDLLSKGVKYDEDLDHATIDFMDAFMATGAAEPTFDGELSISEAVTFNKEDLKPIVRQAIESWLRLKVK